MNITRFQSAFLWGLLLLFAAPLLVYFCKFGGLAFGSHTQFGEFGSFLAGVYAPILGVLTLTVLYIQILAQDSMNAYQIQQNGVTAHFQMIELILADLQKLLDPQIEAGLKLHSSLFDIVADFQRGEPDALIQKSTHLYKNCPRLHELWESYYFAVDGIIGSNDKALQEPISQQIAQGKLSSPICMALDIYLTHMRPQFPQSKLRFPPR